MSVGSRGVSMTRYADTFKRVTSLVLAFLFAVSSPLSVAVAYAQTADAGASSIGETSGGVSVSNDDKKPILRTTNLDPDKLSGSFRYQYPITVPPGRGKLTPSAGLVYNSQTRSDGNMVGYGWSLNVPYIE